MKKTYYLIDCAMLPFKERSVSVSSFDPAGRVPQQEWTLCTQDRETAEKAYEELLQDDRCVFAALIQWKADMPKRNILELRYWGIRNCAKNMVQTVLRYQERKFVTRVTSSGFGKQYEAQVGPWFSKTNVVGTSAEFAWKWRPELLEWDYGPNTEVWATEQGQKMITSRGHGPDGAYTVKVFPKEAR